MILNSFDYNPLPVIFNLLPALEKDDNTNIKCVVRQELFRAGVVPENDEEFDQVLTLLHELRIKEYYGKK